MITQIVLERLLIRRKFISSIKREDTTGQVTAVKHHIYFGS